MAIEDSAAHTQDRHGNISGTVIVFHDVSAARAKTLELSHRAQHDFLTDLPNRVLLNDRINQAISFAARYSKQLAVMFLDLDYFKKINDAFGHAIGDKLLQSVATRLVSCVRRSDTVSRLGGDEFAILLSQVERSEDAVFSAQKILSALAAPYSIDQKHLDINASIGVSTYPSDGQDAETLIQKADTAMYDAKKLGGNSYQFFRADMQARVLERQRLFQPSPASCTTCRGTSVVPRVLVLTHRHLRKSPFVRQPSAEICGSISFSPLNVSFRGNCAQFCVPLQGFNPLFEIQIQQQKDWYRALFPMP